VSEPYKCGTCGRHVFKVFTSHDRQWVEIVCERYDCKRVEVVEGIAEAFAKIGAPPINETMYDRDEEPPHGT